MKLARIAIAALLATVSPAFSATIPPTATPVAGSNVVIDHSTYLVAVNVTTGASAGYVIVVESSTLPADGTVTPVQCVPIAATTGVQLNFRADPINLPRGAAVMFSTGASCFTLAKSATAFISVEVR